MHHPQQFLVGARHVLDLRRNGEGSVLCFIKGHPPDAGEEAGDTLDALHLPGFDLLERAHEHFIEAQCVGTVIAHDIVGVDHVAARLRHLLTVLAEDQPLVDQLLERLGRGHMAEVEQHLVPEARVEQVQHRVLGAADIEIDHARLIAAPVGLGLLRDETRGVGRIAIAQVVPARTRPLRHGVGFAQRAVGQTHPVDRLRQQRIGRAGRFVVVKRRGEQRQVAFGDGVVMAVLPHDRERFAPITLTREQPIAQLVLHAPPAFAGRLEPIDHRRLGRRGRQAVEEAGIHRGAGSGEALPVTTTVGRLHDLHHR